MKSASCLNPVVKDTEVADISHRKEDSDRVPVHKENLYSRLQKHHLSNASKMDHDFCMEQRQCTVAEESNENACPLRLMEVEDTGESNGDGDSMEDERGIPELVAEVDPQTVDNVNSSSYKKGHYSTNACDSIRLSSMSQTHVQQHLHTAESIPEDTNCRSRNYHHLPIRNKENENNPYDVIEQVNCVNKCSKSHSNRFSSMDEQDARKTPNRLTNEESSYEFEDDDSPPPPIEEKKMLQANFQENDILHETSSRSDDECCDLNAAKVIVVQKYDVEKEVESEGCESPITVDVSTVSRSDSVEFCSLNSEEVVEAEVNTENILKCYSSTGSNQEKEEGMTKSDAYVTSVEPTIRMTTLSTTEMNSRINITEGNDATVFSNVQTTNYNSNLTGHMSLEDNRDPALKKSSSRRRDHALDVFSKSSRKLQKKLSSAKSKFGVLTEDVQDDSKSHSKGKNKNKSTKSQRRDRQRSATAEIGEADDDSGIQGDIYEFSEKESNLEDIGILSIIRRGKHESRHASSSSIAVSSVQELQCNDEYNKTEPPVLVPEKPWPPTIAQNEHGAESNSVQSRGNCDVTVSLER